VFYLFRNASILNVFHGCHACVFELVYSDARALGLPAVLQWNKWGDIILEVRKRQELPQYFMGFKYIVKELLKYQEQHSELAT
jgi:hypothetical protein